MSRPRKPTELHVLSGSFDKNPKRAEGRVNEPIPIGDIGDPPDGMEINAAEVWREKVSEAPPGVMKRSDRGALEMWCYVTIRCRSPHATAADFAQFKAYAQQFGMTPAARSLVQVKQEENGNEFAVA